jgi:hypothetical protein
MGYVVWWLVLLSHVQNRKISKNQFFTLVENKKYIFASNGHEKQILQYKNFVMDENERESRKN